ncbi:hypothetical protein OS493_034553 [Desmophyllum pertusum]|uniref:Uncharacterized protein n=1 Tax=Desmophyllum pertusum TaxID=174260 RepID=A0A9W9Y7T4_9CNID|nr:hypothetical protein OS493_034553 [Desmophyllum pertusum]
MEEESMTFEGNTSLVHKVNHMSNANGQVSSEQPETLQQEQDIMEVAGTDKDRSPEEKENGELIKDDLSVEKETTKWVYQENYSNFQREEIVNESKDGEDGVTVKTTLVKIISSHVEKAVEQAQDTENPTEPEQECNDGQTTDEPLHEDSPIVVERKTVSLHTQSIIVNGVTLESKESIEDTLAAEIAKIPVLLPMENVSGHPAAPDDDQQIQESELIAVEKTPVSLHMEPIFDPGVADEKVEEECPGEATISQGAENVPEVQEPIEEASAVAIESEPKLFHYHPMLEDSVVEETAEDKIFDDNSVVEVENESIVTEPDKEGDTETEQTMEPSETRETIAEESPLVVEKRPASLHMEAAFDHEEGDEVRNPIEEDSPELIEKRPVSLHMEHVFDEEGSAEVQEPIEEASTVAVESERRLFHYHPMLEDNVVDETVEDKNLDDNYVEVENESSDTMELEKGQDAELPETRETIAEESPLVVEKRPVSFHMEAIFGHEEGDESREPVEEASPELIEKRPVSLHMEHVFNEEGSTEVQEPIEEASAVAVESEPRLFHYHPMLEDNVVDETVEDKNLDDNYVEVENESSDTMELEKGQDTELPETRETIAEESPLVVEKRPVSLQMEAVFDHEEGDEIRNPIEEDSPELIEKRPVSFHMEAIFGHEEGDEIREPVEEASPELIEKRPVSLHMEQVFDEEGSSEIQEPIEEASAVAVESEPKLFHYHPMLEDNVVDETVEDKSLHDNYVEVENESSVATELEKGEDIERPETRETIAEESPLVVERRPVSLQMEAVFDHEEGDEIREPVEEASPELIEKRPVSLHMEQVFDEEGSAEDDGKEVYNEQVTELKEPVAEAELVVVEKKPVLLQTEVLFEEGSPEVELTEDTKKDSDATVESLLVNIESIIDTPSSQHTEKPEGMNIQPPTDKELVEEGPPVVVEKRAVSLNMEPLFDPESPQEKPGECKEKKDDEGVEIQLDEMEAKVEEEGLVEDARPENVPQEKGQTETREIVDEVITDIVEKKPVLCALYDEHTIENQGNEPVAEEEPSLVNVLDIPQVEKKKDVEDSVQESVDPAVERKVPEFHLELLQTMDTDEQKPEESKHTQVITTTESTSTVTYNQSTSEETTQKVETNVAQTIYEKKTVEVASSSTSSVSDTSTTEETFTSTSYTKRLHRDDKDDDAQLLRHVLTKRLSAPEVLPEKESEGSAPLAASEDRGILESQEQFAVVENSRRKDTTPTNTPQVSGAAPSETEPYEDAPDEEKLIPADAPGEVEVEVADPVEKDNEGADESLPVLLLLQPEEEGKSDKEKKRKKGKKSGLHSPRGKCCSLM